jgi:serine/threonine protein kinase
VAGPTLQTVMAHGPLPESQVAALGRALAHSLAAIARVGSVHLDIKPANVVVNAGSASARLRASPSRRRCRAHDRADRHVALHASERRAASGVRIGPAADVFALAVTLCEALAGRPLERSPDPVAPPGAVGRVLAAALASAPRERPRATELAAALAALADDSPPLGLAA